MSDRLQKSLRPQILESFCSKVSQNTLSSQEKLVSAGITTEDARFTVNLDIFFSARAFKAHFGNVLFIIRINPLQKISLFLKTPLCFHSTIFIF